MVMMGWPPPIPRPKINDSSTSIHGASTSGMSTRLAAPSEKASTSTPSSFSHCKLRGNKARATKAAAA